MKNEIDKDFYCSAGKPWIGGLLCVPRTTEDKAALQPVCWPECDNYHRKYPTPEQYKEEYGEEYPADGAVYYIEKNIKSKGSLIWGRWEAMSYEKADDKSNTFPINPCRIVCACTPFGKPDNDWRPA